MTTAHRSAPDVWSDLLAEALRPDAADPVVIHIRPALHAVICRQCGSTATALTGDDEASRPSGIRLVVDRELPASPGYEIHRALPSTRAWSDPRLPAR